MIKNIIFDLGGIFLPERWPEIVSEMSLQIGVPKEQMASVAKECREQIVTGQMTLFGMYAILLHKRTDVRPADAVKKHLELFKENAIEPDPQMTSFISKLRAKGYHVVCTTNTEKEIADFNSTRENSIFSHFEKAYPSAYIKKSKTNPELYKHIISENNWKADETLFVDNEQQYIDSAQKTGVNTILFGEYKKGFAEFARKLKELGIEE